MIRMDTLLPPSTSGFVAFDDHRRIAEGPLSVVALAVAAAGRQGSVGPLLVFDAAGAVVDLDLRGSDADILERLPAPPADPPSPEPRGRGRPRLGVVAREVTLLPRHWDWLAAQPGGASVALRKLVDDARRSTVDRMAERQRHERAYRFLSAIAGNLQGFEEASRALFAGDRSRFEVQTANWPADVRDHGLRLAFADPVTPSTPGSNPP